jgi:hypothetical protein
MTTQELIHPVILRRLYEQEGRSVRDMALALNVSNTCVWRSLVAAGIPRRRPGRPPGFGLKWWRRGAQPAWPAKK